MKYIVWTVSAQWGETMTKTYFCCPGRNYFCRSVSPRRGETCQHWTVDQDNSYKTTSCSKFVTCNTSVVAIMCGWQVFAVGPTDCDARPLFGKRLQSCANGDVTGGVSARRIRWTQRRDHRRNNPCVLRIPFRIIKNTCTHEHHAHAHANNRTGICKRATLYNIHSCASTSVMLLKLAHIRESEPLHLVWQTHIGKNTFVQSMTTCTDVHKHARAQDSIHTNTMPFACIDNTQPPTQPPIQTHNNCYCIRVVLFAETLKCDITQPEVRQHILSQTNPLYGFDTSKRPPEAVKQSFRKLIIEWMLTQVQTYRYPVGCG